MHWITKRIIRSVVAVFVVINLSFFMIRQMPGGPISYLKSQMQGMSTDMTQREINEIAEVYLQVNPSKPIEEQYFSYMSGVFRGDLGRSVWYNEPVTELLAGALPWTVFVMVLSISLMFGVGVSLGAVMAYMEGERFDYAATIYSIISSSIPYYVVALLAVWILGYQMGLFPKGGKMNDMTTPGFNIPFIVGVFYHAALPTLSFVFTGVGGYALGMRGNSIRVLGEEYLRVARLRGLPRRLIALRYVGRNAILPLYTTIMIQLGLVFGGSVILEQIFVYRGIGYYLYRATVSRDYPLMMGGFILITIAVITGIFIAELSYGWIDPRADEGGAQSESY